jgi:hypothetical protein
LLLTCNCGGTLEVLLCFRGIRLWRLECDFPGNAMHLSIAPLFPRPLHFVYRVVNATPSIVRLVGRSHSPYAKANEQIMRKIAERALDSQLGAGALQRAALAPPSRSFPLLNRVVNPVLVNQLARAIAAQP